MKATWLENEDAGELTIEDLVNEGIHFETMTTDAREYQGSLDRLAKARGYVEQDEIELTPATPNLAELENKFVGEHHHEDDEVRFLLAGAGIFDIRSNDDRWMRVVMHPGDLIVVPKGRHHRFMLTDEKSMRCVRLFKDSSGWVPHYRDASHVPAV